MKEVDYNPFGIQALIIKFPCKECGFWLKTREIEIPSPDYSAETAHDSYNDNHEDIRCPKCQNDYNITVWASYGGGYFRIEELDEESEVDVEEVPEPFSDYYKDQYDFIIENEAVYSNFKSEIENLVKLNEIDLTDIKLNKTLKRQIFISVITAIETFLSDAFINLTINNENYLRNFIESCPEFKKRTIKLSEIYKAQENRIDITKSVMLNILYHDLPKMKEMFEATFNIKFPTIKDLIKVVSKRHHLVHRGGRTKEGLMLEITKEDNQKVIGLTQNFIDDIAEKLNIKGADLTSQLF